MEPYPYYYSRRRPTAEAEEPSDPNFKLLLEEMQKMEMRLGQKLDEKYRILEQLVESSQQKAEARLISLEMS
ncbi:hypothetical protein PR202_ga00726 [Eleusine coracana subsp. coracana]|uniref:Uncharacterized protein n=1 Tax=Eleusine coracana subsp. coracana TaxID=191504 RepID=A0AAV5BI80_ELECO|nr:hypothetical protein PR202_ga00726 [Eleusine coracana subsp. coracana]